nr:MAG TPA: hypothetical protein [Caudoviricetes sp.]
MLISPARTLVRTPQANPIPRSFHYSIFSNL